MTFRKNSLPLCIAALGLCAFLFSGCATTNKGKTVGDVNYGKISLNGMIYNQEGLPVKGVLLTLDDKATVGSDYNGRFSFPNVEPGEHALVTSLEGYEEYKASFTFTRPSEILYVSLLSIDELLALAEKRIDLRDWSQADSYVQRALAVSPKDSRARYLQAILLSSKQRSDRSPEKAKEILLSLLSDGYTNPSVYLFLADIYQYDSSDFAKASEYLRLYLKQRADSDVEKRLKEITKQQ
jgi:tetratricopeptide (TPR) repeat protein